MTELSAPKGNRALFLLCVVALLAPFASAQAAPAAGKGSVAAAPTALDTGNNPDFDAVGFQPLWCN